MPSAPSVRRPLILASVMASMFMIAIEATIVATAMQHCLIDPEKTAEAEDGLTVEELEKLFLSLS